MSGDTVFALATPPGRSAVAVVRLSGAATGSALRSLTGRAPPPPRRASLRTLRDAAGDALDSALVLWTPGPASYTGEDAAELHLHGGPAVIAAVLGALTALGARAAGAGEFTRRAFTNGRLDLAEAEGVADLVDAETDAQRRQALAQLGGAVSDRQAQWRGWLLEAAAMLEAAVDFPDEDLPAEVAARAAEPLQRLRSALAEALADRRGERVRDGYRIALLGAPNAGKSSLLNALAEREAAIVTPVPGTTRDVVEVVLDVAGRRVVLADTAGLRDTADVIEAEGVRRARAWAAAADLRLWVVEPGALPTPPPELRPGDIHVHSKADLAGSPRHAAGVPTSVATPGGTDALRRELTHRVEAATAGDAPTLVTRIRHRTSLEAALVEVELALADASRAPELAVEGVRRAAGALGRLTGEVGSEDVLDQVFASFCIGK